MNPLHLLPPEVAHRVALWSVRRGLAPRCHTADDGPAVRVMGQTWRNPIGLAAGADKAGEGLAGWDTLGFGFVEVGTVTPMPRAGNPKPRLWRLPETCSLINWLGLPGPGVETTVANVQAYRARKQPKLSVGLSIAAPGEGPEALARLAEQCASVADYLTLNASCPNVAHGGGSEAARALEAEIRAVRMAITDMPLLVKLGPTGARDVLDTMVNAALSAGATGFVATNTVPASHKALLQDTAFVWPVREGAEVGGYSGPQLLPVACRMVGWIRETAGPDVPVIGVGGVQRGEDAVRLLESGADAIQLYTGLVYQGPKLVGDIARALIARTHASSRTDGR